MISYIHVPVIALCFFILLSMWRFWACIDRMGFTKEIGRRAPSMIQGDILAAVFASLPFLAAPIPPLLAALISLGCLGGCICMLSNSGERFAGHWAGARESAVRTVAALRIIDAAELARALDVLQQHEARQVAGRIIDSEARKVRK
jgi:hypothetical protein